MNCVYPKEPLGGICAVIEFRMYITLVYTSACGLNSYFTNAPPVQRSFGVW